LFGLTAFNPFHITLGKGRGAPRCIPDPRGQRREKIALSVKRPNPQSPFAGWQKGPVRGAHLYTVIVVKKTGRKREGQHHTSPAANG
jgi:hypothetical protein